MDHDLNSMVHYLDVDRRYSTSFRMMPMSFNFSTRDEGSEFKENAAPNIGLGVLPHIPHNGQFGASATSNGA